MLFLAMLSAVGGRGEWQGSGGGKRGRVDAGDFHNFKDSRVKFSLPVFSERQNSIP